MVFNYKKIKIITNKNTNKQLINVQQGLTVEMRRILKGLKL